MSAIITVRLIGAFSAEINNQLLHFRSDKTVALFVYLLLNPTPIRREQLATLLWPNQPDRARKNLRDALFYLRKALTPAFSAYLVSNRKMVELTGDFDLDTDHLENGDASVIRGELIEGFQLTDAEPFMEWLIPTRERWFERSLVTLAESAEIALSTEDLETAQQMAQRMLQLEPWRESAHRLLMQCFAQRGMVTAAIQQYDRCAQVLQSELGLTPTTATTDLYYQIKKGVVSALPVAVEIPHNLPAEINPLVGRSTKLTQLNSLIVKPHCRLITITGLGGIGKTTLLLTFGRNLHAANLFADGVFFVSLVDIEQDSQHLAPVELERRIATHLLELLNMPFSDDDRMRRKLADGLRNRELLLLIDNWERLLTGARLLPYLLKAAPKLHIVTTSREPLRVVGEHLLPLGGLTTGEGGAFDLFAQRATQAGFAIQPQHIEQIQTICHALGGHPLAIEMAAAWLRGLTLNDVADSLTSGLDFLTSTSQSVPERHRDIRSVFTQSWRMLSERQQACMAHLTLFRQPFTSEAARHITGISPIDLALLTQTSWLRRTANGRYALHELVRQFGREQKPISPAVRDRYIDYHMTLLCENGARLDGGTLVDAIVTLRTHRADVVQAWRWAVSEVWVAQLSECAAALRRFYITVGTIREGIALFDLAIEAIRPNISTHTKVLARLMLEQAYLYTEFVTSIGIPNLLDELAALAEQLNDQHLAIEVRELRCSQLYRLGRHVEAHAMALAILAEAEVANLPKMMWSALTLLGNMSGEAGEFVMANRYYERALTLIDVDADLSRAFGIRSNIAIELAHMGRYKQAQQLHEACYTHFVEAGRQLLARISREGLAEVLMLQGKHEQALSHLIPVLHEHRSADDLEGVANTHMFMGHIAVASDNLALAKTHYQELLQAREKIGQQNELCQGWAGLADVALREGGVAEAVEYAERIVPHILNDTVRGEDIYRVYWNCYRVLDHVDDPTAKTVLKLAVEKLEGIVEQMESAENRQTFLCEVENHRLLLQRYR